MYRITSTYICITQLLVPTKPTHKHISTQKTSKHQCSIKKYSTNHCLPVQKRLKPLGNLRIPPVIAGNRRPTAGNHRFTDVYRRPRQAGGRASDSRSYRPASVALPAINTALKPKSTGSAWKSPELRRKG